MKRTLLFFFALLMGISGVWATDVTVIQSTSDATTYGSLSGETFTTNAASGMAGLTVSGIKGTTATSFAYGACLALTSTQNGTITITAPDGYNITGYSLTAHSNTYRVSYTLTPAAGGSAVSTSTTGVSLTATGLSTQSTSFTYSASEANSFYIPSLTVTVVSATAQLVDVTYNLYDVGDMTTIKATETKTQEANSAINIPSSFVNATYFDYATEGSIGDTDCTISVIRTPKNGVVYPLSNLSNNKAYQLTTARGSLGTNGTQMVSTNGTSFTASNFAIISYEGNYYLWSVADSKWVSANTQPTLTTNDGEAGKVVLTETNAPYFFMGMGSLGVNVAGGYYVSGTNQLSGIVVNSYTTSDPGNQYVITEAANFDPTAALAALEDYFHNYYRYVESEVLPFLMDGSGHPSPTIGKPFGLTQAAATSIVSTYMTQLNNQQFTQAEYEGIVAAKNAGIQYPETGYYRFKNTNRGRNSYLAYGRATTASTNSELNRGYGLVTIDESGMMADASTVFTLTKTAENNYTISTVGLFVTAPSKNNYPFRMDEASEAVTYKFTLLSPGVVAIGPADVTDSNAQKYFHEGDDATWGDVHYVVQWTASSDASHWTVEEATSISVSLATVGAASYSTLYVNFPVSIPDGNNNTAIYTLEENSDSYTCVKQTSVPAKTGMILRDISKAGSVILEIPSSYSNVTSALTGSLLGETAGDNCYIFGNGDEGLGFYHYANGSTLAANKAFLTVASGARSFILNFGDVETGISGTNTLPQSAVIYDLQGRRANQPQRGLYIMNGKKVLF